MWNINNYSLPITLNDPIKSCYSNKKYPVIIQARTTQTDFVRHDKNVFLTGNILLQFKLIDKPVLIRF